METFNIENRRYLGCKSKLIDFIHEVVTNNCEEVKTVADVFAGTGVVAYSFAEDCDVIVNDILRSNWHSYMTFFSDKPFSKDKVKSIIDKYNGKDPDTIKDNYFSNNFGDTYLSKRVMRKVGYIRDDIDHKADKGEINEREKSILITALLYAIDRIANTVGHYDAYRKGAELKQEIKLALPSIGKMNGKNEIYCEDTNALVRHIKADLVYIDPPYNSRQYCDAYHFLENVATNQKPEVVGVARKMDRSQLKSKYCTSRATEAFSDLVNSIDAKYVLVSYNNTGSKNNGRSNAKITDEDIISILTDKGDVKVFEKDYALFTTGKSDQPEHKERLFLCCVNERKEREKILSVADTPSPLNYTGGKFKIINQLRALFPKDIDTFYDVFCGGANVAANVEARSIICVDTNKELISLLNYLKNEEYESVVKSLEKMIYEYGLSDSYNNGYGYYGCDSEHGLIKFNKEPYTHLKEDYNKAIGNKDLMFLLLVFYSFNNQIRFNKAGQFNLPVGKRDFNGRLRKKLKQFVLNIKAKNIQFLNQSYSDIPVENLRGNNVYLYFDPPYYLGDATYNENGAWDEDDEKALLQYIKELDSQGVKFGLSNVVEHKGERHQLLLDWCYENRFNINYLERSYSNSNYHKTDKSLPSKEVLITNYI